MARWLPGRQILDAAHYDDAALYDPPPAPGPGLVGLVLSALDMPLSQRRTASVIHHSDHGMNRSVVRICLPAPQENALKGPETALSGTFRVPPVLASDVARNGTFRHRSADCGQTDPRASRYGVSIPDARTA